MNDSRPNVQHRGLLFDDYSRHICIITTATNNSIHFPVSKKANTKHNRNLSYINERHKRKTREVNYELKVFISSGIEKRDATAEKNKSKLIFQVFWFFVFDSKHACDSFYPTYPRVSIERIKYDEKEKDRKNI